MKFIDHAIKEHIKILNSQKKEIKSKINLFSNIIISKIKSENKILVAGNGGSAADAQHLSTELTVRLKYNGVALPCIALTTDTSALTAIGNDYNFEKIFSRQIEAIGQKNDVFIGISTSGNSKNIINALKIAKKKNVYCLGLLGNKGGEALKYCDESFVVNSSDPSRVQEIHIIFYQLFCAIVEKEFMF